MTREMRRHIASVVPATLYLLVLFVAPIGLILSLSLTGGATPAASYARIFEAPVYLHVLANTFRIGVGVTLGCLVLGYPLAYLVSTLPPRRATLILGMVALPWFTSLLVRSFAWMVLLGQAGIVNRALLAAGVIDLPLPLLYSEFGVHIGMIHILLPYMVLTLYSVMRGIDRGLLRAAEASGASPLRAFCYVYLPLSLPGIMGGSLLVFIMAIGFYVTPALLGGPRQMMIAQIITSEMVESLNWEFGAALAALLLGISIAGLALFNRFFGLDRLIGIAR